MMLIFPIRISLKRFFLFGGVGGTSWKIDKYTHIFTTPRKQEFKHHTANGKAWARKLSTPEQISPYYLCVFHLIISGRTLNNVAKKTQNFLVDNLNYYIFKGVNFF